MVHFVIGLLRYDCCNHHNGEALLPGKKRLDHEVEDCFICLTAIDAKDEAHNLRKKRKAAGKVYKRKHGICRKDEDNNIPRDRCNSSKEGKWLHVSPNWKFVCIFGRFKRPPMVNVDEKNLSEFAYFAVDDLNDETKSSIREHLGIDTNFGNFGQHPFVKTPRPKDPHDVLPEGVEKTCWWLEAIFTHPDHPVAGYEAAQWSQTVFPDEDDEEKEVKAGHLRSGRKRRQNDDDDEYQPSEDSEDEEDEDDDYQVDESSSEDEEDEEDEKFVEKKCKLEFDEDGVIDLTTEDYDEEENVAKDDYNEQIRLGRLVRFVEQFPIYYHNPANLHRDLKKVLDQLSSGDS